MAHIQTDRQTDRHAHIHRDRHTDTDTQTDIRQSHTIVKKGMALEAW